MPSSAKLIKALLKRLSVFVLRPSLKALLFAYLYVTLPKTIDHIVSSVKKGQYSAIFPKVAKTTVNSLHPLRFPVFAAKLVAAINILEPIVFLVIKRAGVFKGPVNLFVATLVSSFLAALASFPAFQSHILGYGRFYLLDLTLLVAIRATDTALSATLAKIVPPSLGQYGDVLLFTASSTLIMFLWFFEPQKLPPAYRRWITSAASMDNEIVDALLAIRKGTLKYGNEGPLQDMLVPYCERYGQDPKRGSLIENQPLECELVHGFKIKNCELHALWRFQRGFVFAMKIYGPLNAIMLLFPNKQPMRSRILRAIKASSRSSAFLGTFIALCWYGVCLSRTRLLPKLFPNVPKTRWDDTVGPLLGSLLCGLSSLVDSASRRKELALFVAPRALGTIVSAEPTPKNLRVESVVFSLSMAVLVAYLKSDPKKVRGIFGKGLPQVFNIPDYK